MGRVENLEPGKTGSARKRLGKSERRETRPAHAEHHGAVGVPESLSDEGLEPPHSRRHPVGNRQPAERALDRAAVRVFRFPESGVLRPDALDGAVPGKLLERCSVGALGGAQLEAQATLIGFSFFSSAFISSWKGSENFLAPPSSRSRENRF